MLPDIVPPMTWLVETATGQRGRKRWGGDMPDGETGRHRSRFFLIAAAMMATTVFIGFLPSFFLRFHFRSTPLPLYFIVHGCVMTAWELLFVTQTILVARRRIDLHRRLGRVGAVLAVAVVAAGVNVTLRMPSFYAGQPALPFPIEPMVIGNLVGFATFGGLVAAAIVQRRTPAAHARLMYWACIVTVGPALTPGRTLGMTIAPYFPTTFPPEIAFVWIAWIALLIHDWRSTRGFHPVTIVGGVLLLFVLPALIDWSLQSTALLDWVRSLA